MIGVFVFFVFVITFFLSSQNVGGKGLWGAFPLAWFLFALPWLSLRERSAVGISGGFLGAVLTGASWGFWALLLWLPTLFSERLDKALFIESAFFRRLAIGGAISLIWLVSLYLGSRLGLSPRLDLSLAGGILFFFASLCLAAKLLSPVNAKLLR
jgi:hypothetical protein